VVVFDGEPFFVRINGRVWVTPEEVPEDSQCTAMTKRRKRCGNPLDYGQSNGYSWLKVEGGYVDGFDYDGDNGKLTERGRRYMEQRCELHFDTDAPSAVEPEWAPFVAAEHAGRIVSAERAMGYMSGGPAVDPPGPTNLAPSPENDGMPIEVLRPVMDRRDLSLGARGLWAMLVSYNWSCEDNRTVEQLHEHRPQDADETDALLAELSGVGLIEVLSAPSGDCVVSINPDALGVARPASDSRR
jgi:hypothetical protein